MVLPSGSARLRAAFCHLSVTPSRFYHGPTNLPHNLPSAIGGAALDPSGSDNVSGERALAGGFAVDRIRAVQIQQSPFLSRPVALLIFTRTCCCLDCAARSSLSLSHP